MFIRLRRIKVLTQCFCFTLVSILILYYTYLLFFIKTEDGEDIAFFREETTERRWMVGRIAHKVPTNQTCVPPDTDPFNPSVTMFFERYPPVNCTTTEEDWVYTVRGTFRISRRALRLHGNIKCEYIPLERSDDFSVREGLHVKPMLDGEPLKTDFFKVYCVSSAGRSYMNIHSGVARNRAVFSRLEKMAEKKEASHSSSRSMANISSFPLLTPSSTHTSKHDSVSSSLFINSTSLPGLSLSVFILGFESLSRMSWIRLLPRTRWDFLETLGGIELEGYNIVGGGKAAALLPILTGHQEEELPEARRGMPGAQPVDGHPWVWKEFKRHGYVTAYAEDMASIGTFGLDMLGFKEQPTDHNMRLFYLEAEKMYKNNAPYCLGSTPRHRIFMNWFEELFATYTRNPKFFFGFHGEMIHNNSNLVQALDEDLALFLDRLEKSGHLNSTFLILMADHGDKNSNVRLTKQGKVEERMPYFAFRFPPWVKQVYPQLYRNLKINTQRLTTPFDIHETLMEVLTYSGSGVGDLSKRAISLFKEIPENRRCSHAGVTPHWCACLKWDTLNMSDSTVLSAVKSAISEINSYTKSNRQTCALLSLKKITFAARYLPTYEDYVAEQKLRKHLKSFRQSRTWNHLDANQEVYQVSFITSPGNGHFEVTCTLDTTTGKFSVASTDISRINMYGKNADCIVNSYPHIRRYCYCKVGFWRVWQ